MKALWTLRWGGFESGLVLWFKGFAEVIRVGVGFVVLKVLWRHGSRRVRFVVLEVLWMAQGQRGSIWRIGRG